MSTRRPGAPPPARARRQKSPPTTHPISTTLQNKMHPHLSKIVAESIGWRSVVSNRGPGWSAPSRCKLGRALRSSHPDYAEGESLEHLIEFAAENGYHVICQLMTEAVVCWLETEDGQQLYANASSSVAGSLCIAVLALSESLKNKKRKRRESK